MLLMDIEKEIQPLSHNEKLRLMRRIAGMLLEEKVAPEAVEKLAPDPLHDFQPDPAKLRLLSAIAPRPYEPLYDADEAAQTFYQLKRSDSVPVI